MRTLAIILASTLLLAAPAAGKNRKIHDSITVANHGGAVTATVHLDAPLLPNVAYGIWVANICTDSDGVVLEAEYLPVRWGDNLDLQPVDGTAGPFAAVGASCNAYSWVFPDAWTPVDSVTYTP